MLGKDFDLTVVFANADALRPEIMHAPHIFNEGFIFGFLHGPIDRTHARILIVPSLFLGLEHEEGFIRRPDWFDMLTERCQRLADQGWSPWAEDLVDDKTSALFFPGDQEAFGTL